MCCSFPEVQNRDSLLIQYIPASCRFQEEADKKAAEEKARGGFAEDFSQLDLMEE